MKTFDHIKKFISWVIIFSFTAFSVLEHAPRLAYASSADDKTEIAAPLGNLGARNDSGLSLRGAGATKQSLAIPSNLGTIERSKVPGTFEQGPQVYYIQDAHNSLEAQENIAKLIDHLAATQGVRQVYVEGYEGEGAGRALDRLYSFQDPEVKSEVSRFFLDYLRLSGAQFGYVNRKTDFQLTGIENAHDYLSNLRSYEAASKTRIETGKSLDVIAKHLKILADRLYPKEIQEYQKLKARFEAKQLSLGDYVFRMMKLAPTPSLSHEGRGTLTQPSPLMGEGKGEGGRYPHLSLVTAYLSKTQLTPAEQKELSEKLKAVDHRVFFGELAKFEDELVDYYLDQEKGTGPQKGPVPESPARATFRYQEKVALLTKLNQLQLMPEEYDELTPSSVILSASEGARDSSAQRSSPLGSPQNDKSKEFSPSPNLSREGRGIPTQPSPLMGEGKGEGVAGLTTELAHFLAKNLRKPIVLNKEWETDIQDALRFYELAKKRDENFKQRLISPLKIRGGGGVMNASHNPSQPPLTLRGGESPIILVTGGFHTDFLTHFFEKENISYVLIAPKITKDDPVHQKRYDFLMSGNTYPFESLPATGYQRLATTLQQITQPNQVEQEGIGPVAKMVQAASRALKEGQVDPKAFEAIIRTERAFQASGKSLGDEFDPARQSVLMEKIKKAYQEVKSGETSAIGRIDPLINPYWGIALTHFPRPDGSKGKVFSLGTGTRLSPGAVLTVSREKDEIVLAIRYQKNGLDKPVDTVRLFWRNGEFVREAEIENAPLEEKKGELIEAVRMAYRTMKPGEIRSFGDISSVADMVRGMLHRRFPLPDGALHIALRFAPEKKGPYAFASFTLQKEKEGKFVYRFSAHSASGEDVEFRAVWQDGKYLNHAEYLRMQISRAYGDLKKGRVASVAIGDITPLLDEETGLLDQDFPFMPKGKRLERDFGAGKGIRSVSLEITRNEAKKFIFEFTYLKQGSENFEQAFRVWDGRKLVPPDQVSGASMGRTEALSVIDKASETITNNLTDIALFAANTPGPESPVILADLDTYQKAIRSNFKIISDNLNHVVPRDDMPESFDTKGNIIQQYAAMARRLTLRGAEDREFALSQQTIGDYIKNTNQLLTDALDLTTPYRIKGASLGLGPLENPVRKLKTSIGVHLTTETTARKINREKKIYGTALTVSPLASILSDQEFFAEFKRSLTWIAGFGLPKRTTRYQEVAGKTRVADINEPPHVFLVANSYFDEQKTFDPHNPFPNNGFGTSGSPTFEKVILKQIAFTKDDFIGKEVEDLAEIFMNKIVAELNEIAANPDLNRPYWERIRDARASGASLGGKPQLSLEEAKEFFKWVLSNAKDDSYSFRLAEETLKRPIQNILMIGGGLAAYPFLMALTGKNVIVIEKDPDSIERYRQAIDDLKVLMDEYGIQGTPVLWVFRWPDNVPPDYLSDKVGPSAIDLVTFIDISSRKDFSPTVDKWVQAAKVWASPSAYLLFDERASGPGSQFQKAFPKTALAAPGKNFKGNGRKDRGKNTLYQLVSDVAGAFDFFRDKDWKGTYAADALPALKSGFLAVDGNLKKIEEQFIPKNPNKVILAKKAEFEAYEQSVLDQYRILSDSLQHIVPGDIFLSYYRGNNLLDAYRNISDSLYGAADTGSINGIPSTAIAVYVAQNHILLQETQVLLKDQAVRGRSLGASDLPFQRVDWKDPAHIKILVPEKIKVADLMPLIAQFEKLGRKVEILDYSALYSDAKDFSGSGKALDVVMRHKEPDILVVRSDTVLKDDKKAANRYLLDTFAEGGGKLVLRAGAGYDNIDAEYAETKGVHVAVTYGNAVSVAELAVRSIAYGAFQGRAPPAAVDLAEKYPQIFKLVKTEYVDAEAASPRGKADEKTKVLLAASIDPEIFANFLKGKTVGLVGFGNIARPVAEKLRSLEAASKLSRGSFKIKAFSKSLIAGKDSALALAKQMGVEAAPLGEILKTSDVVSLHLPLSAQTKGIVNLENVKFLHGKIVVNTSRAELVTAEAVKDLAENGGLYFAEFSTGDPKLDSHPNVYVTPHIAASTKSAKDGVAENTVKTLEDAISGRLGEVIFVNRAPFALSVVPSISPVIPSASEEPPIAPLKVRGEGGVMSEGVTPPSPLAPAPSPQPSPARGEGAVGASLGADKEMLAAAQEDFIASFRGLMEQKDKMPYEEWKNELIGTYGDLLERVLVSTETAGQESVFVYPFMGTDLVPALFRKTISINNDPADVGELGMVEIAPVFGEGAKTRVLANTLNWHENLNALDPKSYDTVMEDPAQHILILKGFSRFGIKAGREAVLKMLDYLLVRVLKQGDKILVLDTVDLDFLNEALQGLPEDVRSQFSQVSDSARLLDRKGEVVFPAGYKIFAMPNMVSLFEKTSGASLGEGLRKEFEKDVASDKRFELFKTYDFRESGPQSATRYYTEFKAWYNGLKEREDEIDSSRDEALKQFFKKATERYSYVVAKIVWIWHLEGLGAKIRSFQEAEDTGGVLQAASDLLKRHEHFMGNHPNAPFLQHDPSVEIALKDVRRLLGIAEPKTAIIPAKPNETVRPAPETKSSAAKTEAAGARAPPAPVSVRTAPEAPARASKIDLKKIAIVLTAALALSAAFYVILPVNLFTVSLALILPLSLFIIFKTSWPIFLLSLGFSVVLATFLPIPWFGLSLAIITIAQLIFGPARPAQHRAPGAASSAGGEKGPALNEAEILGIYQKKFGALPLSTDVMSYVLRIAALMAAGRSATKSDLEKIDLRFVMDALFQVRPSELIPEDPALKERLKPLVRARIQGMELGFDISVLEHIRKLKHWPQENKDDLARALQEITGEIARDLSSQLSARDANQAPLVIQEIIGEYFRIDKERFMRIQLSLMLLLVRERIESDRLIGVTSAENLYLEGRIEFFFKNYRIAAQAFESAARLEPSNTHYLLTAGIVDHYLKKWEQAQTFYKRSLDIREQVKQPTEMEKLKLGLNQLLLQKAKAKIPLEGSDSEKVKGASLGSAAVPAGGWEEVLKELRITDPRGGKTIFGKPIVAWLDTYIPGAKRQLGAFLAKYFIQASYEEKDNRNRFDGWIRYHETIKHWEKMKTFILDQYARNIPHELREVKGRLEEMTVDTMILARAHYLSKHKRRYQSKALSAATPEDFRKARRLKAYLYKAVNSEAWKKLGEYRLWDLPIWSVDAKGIRMDLMSWVRSYPDAPPEDWFNPAYLKSLAQISKSREPIEKPKPQEPPRQLTLFDDFTSGQSLGRTSSRIKIHGVVLDATLDKSLRHLLRVQKDISNEKYDITDLETLKAFMRFKATLRDDLGSASDSLRQVVPGDDLVDFLNKGTVLEQYWDILERLYGGRPTVQMKFEPSREVLSTYVADSLALVREIIGIVEYARGRAEGRGSPIPEGKRASRGRVDQVRVADVAIEDIRLDLQKIEEFFIKTTYDPANPLRLDDLIEFEVDISDNFDVLAEVLALIVPPSEKTGVQAIQYMVSRYSEISDQLANSADATKRKVVTKKALSAYVKESRSLLRQANSLVKPFRTKGASLGEDPMEMKLRMDDERSLVTPLNPSTPSPQPFDQAQGRPSPKSSPPLKVGYTDEEEGVVGASLGKVDIAKMITEMTQPVPVFVDMADYMKFSDKQRNEFLMLALQKRIKAVIYNDTESRVNADPNLMSLKNVISYRGDAAGAFAAYGQVSSEKIIHLSREADAREKLSRDRFYFFRQTGDESGALLVALLYQLSDGKLRGVEEKDGFLIVDINSALLKLVQEYEASFEIAKAA